LNASRCGSGSGTISGGATVTALANLVSCPGQMSRDWRRRNSGKLMEIQESPGNGSDG